MSDTISRQSFLDKYQKICDSCGEYEKHNGVMCGTCYFESVVDIVENEPSAQPERKKGKWVNNIHDIPICNQCGYMTPYDRAIDDYEYGNFCPNCGADMRGEGNETQVEKRVSERNVGEWNMFDLITSTYYGKKMYFKQDNGIVYSRYSCKYMSVVEAIMEFLALIGEDGNE